MERTWPFYVFTISLFISVVGVTLLSDGMFFDGVFYANFSKVMAQDFQGFWTLKSCFHCQELYGHPPLAIFLESLWFKIFGDSMYVERFYSFSTYLISGLLIHLIFKEIYPKKKHYSFIAILFWIITPLVTWGAANNMLENTLSVFVLSAVLFLVRATLLNSVLEICLAGIFIFLAFLTKGFIGTFPLIFFGLYFLFFRNLSLMDMLFKSAILIISFLFPFLIIYLFFENGAFYLNKYFAIQVVHSIQNDITVSSRFFILERLFNELLPSLVLLIVFVFIKRKSFIPYGSKWSFLFIVLALCGVLPIMISLKQSGFYILSALPIFSLGFSFFIAEHFNLNFKKMLQNKWIKPTSLALFFVSLIIMFWQVGKIGRDEKMLNDIYVIVNFTEDEIISIPHELYWHWSLKAYFYRYGGVELSSNHYNLKDYFLIEKGKNDDLLNKYQEIKSIELEKFRLFKLTDL